MNLIKYYKLIDYYIDNLHLSVNDILLMGYSYQDLEFLLANKMLSYKDNVLLINSDFIISYFKEVLYKDKNYNRMIACCNLILEQDPINRYIIYQLFIIYVVLEDYDKAYYYLDKLYSIADETILIDCNFYLYLMSHLEKVPSTYKTLKNYVKDMELMDLIYSKKPYYREELRHNLNKIHSAVYNGNYTYALYLYNNFTKKYGIFNRDYISKIILYRVVDNEKEESNVILDNIVGRNYFDAYEIICHINEKHPLNSRLLSTKYLLESIFELALTLQEKEIINSDSNEHFSALIKNNNFRKSLELNISYINKYKISSLENSIHLLLKDIVYLLDCIDNNCLSYEDSKYQILLVEAIKYQLALDGKIIPSDIEKINFNNKEEVDNYILKQKVKSLKR